MLRRKMMVLEEKCCADEKGMPEECVLKLKVKLIHFEFRLEKEVVLAFDGECLNGKML